MNRLELIREIHALIKNEKKEISQIQYELINKRAKSKKKFFKEWKVAENNIKGEQWHQFVRFCINFEEMEYMFRRINYLLRRYRHNTDEYFKAKFQKGISELPDRSSELEQLFKFSNEYFEIYKKILTRINFEQTNVLSTVRIEGKINWNATLTKSITDFPLSFEVDKWEKRFTVPENILLIWITMWLSHQIQRLLANTFEYPLDISELKTLKRISTRCKSILKHFPFYNVVEVVRYDFDMNVRNKKIQILELEVTRRLKEGFIENTAYGKLLIWFSKMKTFNFTNIKKKDRTIKFLLDAVKNIDEMYEIWIFFELLHCFQKYVDVTLALDSECQSIQFTLNYQKVELFYEKPFSEKTEFAWAHSHTPDFTILSNQKILGVLDAKNYKNAENKESPKNKILAYMTNLSTGFGGIIWSNNYKAEYVFPRSSTDSTKYHNNLKLALYPLNPRTMMENTGAGDSIFDEIFAEIKNRLESATKCSHCGEIAISEMKIKELFGLQNIDEIIRNSSWCIKCRNL